MNAVIYFFTEPFNWVVLTTAALCLFIDHLNYLGRINTVAVRSHCSKARLRGREECRF